MIKVKTQTGFQPYTGQPRQGIILRLTKELKNFTFPEMLNKRSKKEVECLCNAVIAIALFGYTIYYLLDDSCHIAMYTFYHYSLVVLIIIDFYYEFLLLKVLRQLSQQLYQIIQKNETLDDQKVRFLIYRFSEQSTREGLMPPNQQQCRKITFYFAVLAFIGQLSFISRRDEFSCHFEAEPLIINAAIWIAYIVVAFSFRMVNSVGSSFIFQSSLTGSHFQDEPIEQLEQQWKIRSSVDTLIHTSKISPQSPPQTTRAIDTVDPKQKSSQIIEAHSETKEDYECQICLMGFESGTIARKMICCKKIFHYDCCLKWFLDKPSCPNCRATPSSHIDDTPTTEQQFYENILVRQFLEQQQNAQHIQKPSLFIHDGQEEVVNFNQNQISKQELRNNEPVSQNQAEIEREDISSAPKKNELALYPVFQSMNEDKKEHKGDRNIGDSKHQQYPPPAWKSRRIHIDPESISQ